MTRRTLPAQFPIFRLSDFNTYKTGRATKVRWLAAATNWLWANMVRFYAYSAYEGNGYGLSADYTDSAQGVQTQLPPGGSLTAKLLSSFIVPPNWGPSSTIVITGRSYFGDASGSGNGAIVVGVYGLDEVFTGITKTWTYNTPGANDWQQELSIPQDKCYQVKVWMDPTLLQDLLSPGVVPGDTDAVTNITVRYKEAVAADLSTGDTPPTAYTTISDTYVVDGENAPLTSALMKQIAKNVLHLWTMRPPHIMSTYFGPTHALTSTYEEVARYKVKLGPNCTKIRGRCDTFSFGTGNAVRVLVDGVVKETFTGLAAGTSAQTWATITGLAAGTEITITVEAKCTTAGTGGWGTVVDGVYAWEYEQDMLLPAGTTIPVSFIPIDEEGVSANKPVFEDMIQRLIANTLYVAANRQNTLVQDWRHRTYKRAGINGTEMYPGGDWTRGNNLFPAYLESMKNITVFGQSAQADSQGSTSPNDRDGRGYATYGYAFDWTASLSSWPIPSNQVQLCHGKRLLQTHYSPDGSPDNAIWSEDSDGLVRGWVRGRRVRPYLMMAFDLGSAGPLPEEAGFINAANITLYSGGGTLLATWPLVGTPARPDHESAWYGPDFVGSSDWGTLNGRGNLLSRLTTTNPLEGALFEVELNSTLFSDVPLTQRMLDAI